MNKRLTDRKVAEDLLHNSERLAAAGFDVPIDHKRYIKLARYEDEEERKEKALKMDYIKNKLAWALYQTLKEELINLIDKYEAKK